MKNANAVMAIETKQPLGNHANRHRVYMYVINKSLNDTVCCGVHMKNND